MVYDITANDIQAIRQRSVESGDTLKIAICDLALGVENDSADARYLRGMDWTRHDAEGVLKLSVRRSD